MPFSWSSLSIPRFYGLDLKTNVIDVKDGESLGAENVYQNSLGVVSKRPGTEIMFTADEAGSTKVDEIGTCTISGTKYWFKFSNGKFSYSTSRTGAVTTLSPSPAISTTFDIWWAVLDSKLFFVDGSNVLRYFNGSAIKTSSILARPTVAATLSAGTGTGFDFSYTVDNQLGESPICPTPLLNKGSTNTIAIAGNTGPQTLAVGDRIRVYSKANGTLAQYRNVTTTSGSDANGTYGSDSSGGYYTITSTTATYAITTIALNDSLAILYTDLGVAINASAPPAFTGITVHYGRLVGWKGSNVYVSKVSNPHSFPPDSAVREAFTYGFFRNDGEDIQVCKSYQENLYVAKDTKVAVFGGVGPDDTGNNAFTFRRLETNGIGCVAGKTMQVVGDSDNTNYLLWLARDGFYASTGDKPVRVGENIETQIQPISLSNQRKSVSIYHKRIGFYLCFVGNDAAKSGWIFDLKKDDEIRVGWFKLTELNPTAIAWDDDRFLIGNNAGFCSSERVAGTSNDFADIKTEYFAPSAVNTSTEEITVVNSYVTGDTLVVRSSGTVPAGLTANATYYAIRVSPTKIKLATSSANAALGTAINLTSQGSGTHSIVASKAISAFYTTNWIKFKRAAEVKKLAKPMVLLNASATSINLTMQIAVDWFESFFDSHVLSVTSSDLWGTLPWGSFIWGAGTVSAPKNVAIARRKCRSIRFKFSNETINQDFNLKGLELTYSIIRNRGELNN